MIRFYNEGMFCLDGNLVPASQTALDRDAGRKKTIAYGILASHNTSGDMQALRLHFDADPFVPL